MEVFRKYLWFLLRERQFDVAAVDDMTLLKNALGLTDDEVRGSGVCVVGVVCVCVRPGEGGRRGCVSEAGRVAERGSPLSLNSR